jgi:hypothetical protein
LPRLEIWAARAHAQIQKGATAAVESQAQQGLPQSAAAGSDLREGSRKGRFESNLILPRLAKKTIPAFYGIFKRPTLNSAEREKAPRKNRRAFS